MAKKDSKKALQKQVENTLTESFPDIRTSLGDKKFFKNVKKASKALVAGAGGGASKAKAVSKKKAEVKPKTTAKGKNNVKTADKKAKTTANKQESPAS